MSDPVRQNRLEILERHSRRFHNNILSRLSFFMPGADGVPQHGNNGQNGHLLRFFVDYMDIIPRKNTG